jgi:hypothetical protein
MVEAVYVLCTLTSLLCAVLLGRTYHRSRVRLLLWSSLCFFGLAINNVLLFLDLIVFPKTDMFVWRSIPALAGLLLLLYGLIWDAD